MLYGQFPSPIFYILNGYNDNISQAKICHPWLTGTKVFMGIKWYLNLRLSQKLGPPCESHEDEVISSFGRVERNKAEESEKLNNIGEMGTERKSE